MYTQKALRRILEEVQSRRLSVRKGLGRLKDLPYESFSFARIDHHRHLRKGLPEAVYGQGKTLEQLARILRSIRKTGQPLLVTRVEENVWKKLRVLFPELEYSVHGRVVYGGVKKRLRGGSVGILTAGTSDLPVAEEARVTLELMGIRTECFYDCGAAGFHRLLDVLPKLRRASLIICIAGMDGVLPTLAASLLDKPVVAVPTSVGYGANFKGMAPLLTMLNTCAQGVAVVNIDNGFGAACFAALAVCAKAEKP